MVYGPDFVLHVIFQVKVMQEPEWSEERVRNTVQQHSLLRGDAV